ncbi:hypothetical protein ACFVMC_13660 [Nocardia sp. NPDC127579]|uniref:hypothetical protein n=1 Tax=Nocardia sp. NPDC127579 TaxID=3345402 RepID=UPI003626F6DF
MRSAEDVRDSGQRIRQQAARTPDTARLSPALRLSAGPREHSARQADSRVLPG